MCTTTKTAALKAAPVVTVEPTLWEVHVDGVKAGAVVRTTGLGGVRWYAHRANPFGVLGSYPTKEESVAAVLAEFNKPAPEACPTCGQVAA